MRYPFSKDKALNKFILSNEAALLGRDDISNEDYSAAIADLADEVRQALDRFEAQMPDVAGLADDFRRRIECLPGLPTRPRSRRSSSSRTIGAKWTRGLPWMRPWKRWPPAGKAGATDAAIKSALRRHDFVDPSQAVVDLARRAIDALRQSPTNYFEAKPQRAVKLSEFRGAVVPKGLPAAARDVLERAGVQVVEYNARDQGARAKAIATLTKRLDKPAKDVLFSRSAATREAYESRIDELFMGKKPRLDGVRVLDRSDVLSLLGAGSGPVRLAEGKVNTAKHPNMTAEVWKKIPEWLDNPAAVFDSDTVNGRLVFVAPESVNGAPVLLVVQPDGQSTGHGVSVHLLVNAYDKDGGAPPFGRWLKEGKGRYVNQKEFPAILRASGLQLSSTAWQNKPGTPRILTEKNLAGWRKANDASLARYSFAGQRAATAERHALASAEQRIAAGEDAEAVRQDTGWHKGSDGKWRFEINDADAKLALAPDEFKAFAGAGGTVRLGDVLDHTRWCTQKRPMSLPTRATRA